MEIAHVQYYGWALANRAALLPTREQLDEATRVVEAARERLKGVLVIDYVVPDYYAQRPKSCMGGWGRQFLNVTPSGKVLPCHAAEILPGSTSPRCATSSLCGHLVPLGRLQPVSRHRLDARALPHLRPARNRLGRLPLPGLRADRRCSPHRPGLRPVAGPPPGRDRGGGRSATAASPHISPLRDDQKVSALDIDGVSHTYRKPALRGSSVFD